MAAHDPPDEGPDHGVPDAGSDAGPDGDRAGWAPTVDGCTQLVEIGSGASGRVFRATETALGRQVAVKVLSSALTDEERQRFEREIRVLGELSGHPNIVTVYRSGTAPTGEPFIVMELMGRSIERSGPLPATEVAAIVTGAAAGLAAAHDAGVVHRDVKPANIFLDRFGAARLGDFGIAGVGGSGELTTGSIGSPAYMAPEVIAGNRAEPASDTYSLAATAYELLEGRPPFQPPDGGIPALLHAVLSASPDPMQRATDAVAEVIIRALAKAPTARFESPERFAAALTAASAQPPVEAADRTVVGQAPVVPVDPASLPAPAPAEHREGGHRVSGARDSRRTMMIAGGAIAAGVIGFGLWSAVGGGDSDENDTAPTSSIIGTTATTTDANADTNADITVAADDLPIEFQSVVDSSGRWTIDVPAAWTVSRSPGQIVAVDDTGDGRIRLTSTRRPVDPIEDLASIAAAEGCSIDNTSAPYDDGAFEGVNDWATCVGANGAEVPARVISAGFTADPDFWVQVFITPAAREGETAIEERAILSFNIDL